MEYLVVALIGVVFAIASLVLLSLGLAIIYGMMGVINLAQGEFIMLGAYTVVLSSAHGLDLWVGMALAPVVVGVVGLLVERCIVRFLYGRLLDTMLATWGLSLCLIAAVTLILGPSTEGVATPFGHVAIGGYVVSTYNLFVIAATGFLVALTWGLFNRTRFGLIARGAIQNSDIGAVLGIHSLHIDILTFALGYALEVLEGAIMATLNGVDP